jgi:hypothetical protein
MIGRDVENFRSGNLRPRKPREKTSQHEEDGDHDHSHLVQPKAVTTALKD